jgi:regulatory protein
MIVKFRLKEGRRDYWEILIDGEKWREVHRTIFGSKPVFPPVSSMEDLKTVFEAYESHRVKGYLLWRLSKQSYHSEQLAKLLRDRLVQIQTITHVLGEFQDKGYLNDKLWLKNFFQIENKRGSLRLILAKLYKKGFSKETLKELSEEWNNPEEEETTLLYLMNTRYRNKDFTDRKTKQKVTASLLRKGFSFEQIKGAFKNNNL